MDDMGNIVAALRTSPTQTFTNVTFPEGYAVARMGARLEKTVPRLTAANFVAAATSGQIQSELAPRRQQPRGPALPRLVPDRRQRDRGADRRPPLAADDPGGQQRRHPERPEPRRSFAVRGPHRGVDDREGGQGRRGPGPHRPRHLQPAVRRHAAADRRHPLLRAGLRRRRSARCRAPTRRTTRTSTSACRPRRSPTRARSRSRPRCTRRPTPTRRRAPVASRASGCTTCWPTRTGATPSPPPTRTT